MLDVRDWIFLEVKTNFWEVKTIVFRGGFSCSVVDIQKFSVNLQWIRIKRFFVLQVILLIVEFKIL